MKYLALVLRVLIAVFFIFSALVKLVDPLGTAYKMEEYFSPNVLNWPIFEPYSLYIAIFIILLELVLGICLLLGLYKNKTLGGLLVLILFFSFLTFYSAFYNKVTDCGCFGDFIKLNPWTSFYKDVLLGLLVLLLCFLRKYINPLLGKTKGFLFVLSVIFMGLFISYDALRNLPRLDFSRAFAVGKNIIEQMKTAKQLGLLPPVYQTYYTIKNKGSGQEKIVNAEQYIDQNWWKDADWEILPEKTKEAQIREGYVPKITNFILKDSATTQSLLNIDNLLIISVQDVEKASKKGIEALQKLESEFGIHDKIQIIVVSPKEIKGFKSPLYVLDQTLIKTMIRSNPGLLFIKKGKVQSKWSWQNTPKAKELNLTLINHD